MSQPAIIVKVSGLVSLVIGLLLCAIWGALVVGHLSAAPSDLPVVNDFATLRTLCETVGLGLVGAGMLVSGWALSRGKTWARTLANVCAGFLAVLAPLYAYLTFEANSAMQSAFSDASLSNALDLASPTETTRQTILIAAVVACYALGLLVVMNRPNVRKHFQARFYGMV